jgi:predicted dehydrogenase
LIIQDIINDRNIDCVFIPLPNGLHFEWTVRAIRAGKHVLLEKPCVSNGDEAERLFGLPELSGPGAPILLEAFHNRFHPAWELFQSFINPADVVHASSFSMIPWWGIASRDEIYFSYALAGGAMMQMGTYNFGALREVFGADPEECLSCEAVKFPDADKDQAHPDLDKIDTEAKATFQFPNGIGEAHCTLQGPSIWIPSYITVTHKKIMVPDQSLPATQRLFRKREVTLHGMIHAVAWHRIDVTDYYEIQEGEESAPVKTWEEKKSHKAYTFRETTDKFTDLPGESFWMSYRYQLEAFVDRVRGKDTAHWVDKHYSLSGMRMLDMAYEKAGLGKRPTSTFT